MIPDLVTKSVHRMSTSGGDHGANFFSITGHLMSRSLDSGSFFMVLQLVSGGDMVMTRVYIIFGERIMKLMTILPLSAKIISKLR